MRALIGLALIANARAVYGQSSIAPPAGSALILTAKAKGVQIYTCKPLTADASKFAYDAAHAEPDAVLRDARQEVVVHHYFNFDPAGPAWEGRDGSKVVAKKIDQAEAHAGAVPWLLLEVIAHEGNTGLLSKVTHIQRVDTDGGVAPTGSCDPAKAPRIRVPYTATYKFFGTK